jgi:hypothetical protein
MTASLFGGVGEARRHDTFLLKPVEHHEQRAACHASPQSALNLIVNGAPVSVVAQADEREERRLFKISECLSHNAYIVGRTGQVFKSPILRAATLDVAKGEYGGG